MKRALIIIALSYSCSPGERCLVFLSPKGGKAGGPDNRTATLTDISPKASPLPGTIQPVDVTINVGCQVSGTINGIYTDYNAKVTKHQLIATLDKSLFEATVNSIQSQPRGRQSIPRVRLE